MALTLEIVRDIIERIPSGESVDRMIKAAGARHPEFWAILEQKPELAKAYELASRARAEVLADEIIEIADTDDCAIRARTRVDARKWLASKLQPQKFGDRQIIDINQTIDIGQAMLEARQRVLPVSDQHLTIDAEYTEESTTSRHNIIDKQSVEPVEALKKPLPDLFD